MDLALDSAAFLRDVWQKRPLLIRGAFPAWRNPLDPDELAGLACEDGVESRLVLRQGETWALEHGPFAEDRFARLGKAPWSLLVQGVDRLVDDVAMLIEPFRFVPDWRIDDVMISYAVDQGGVGPHFDQYDVFLIQGLGRRRWRVGPRCDSTTPLVPHADLRLLAGFEALEEWVLEPGDVLYLPPGFAHDGVALGDDCMTYSVGFRAPSSAELVDGWSEQVASLLSDDERYADPDLAPQSNPAEITATALDRLQAMVIEALSDREGFARWFGAHATAPKFAEEDWRPDEPLDRDDLVAALDEDGGVRVNPASRFAFVREPAGRIALFVDGETYRCEGGVAAFAERLCAAHQVTLDPATAGADVLDLVLALVNQGSVMLDADGDDDYD